MFHFLEALKDLTVFCCPKIFGEGCLPEEIKGEKVKVPKDTSLSAALERLMSHDGRRLARVAFPSHWADP